MRRARDRVPLTSPTTRMYSSALTAGALRLLHLMLNPIVTSGLQSAAWPYSMAPYSMAPYSMAPYSMAPYSMAPYNGLPLSTAPYNGVPLSTAPYNGLPYSYRQSGNVEMPSSMAASFPVASMPMTPLPYAPWLIGANLPVAPATPATNGPVYVPASVLPSLFGQQGEQQAGQQAAQPSSVAAGALAALEQAIAPYTSPSAQPASSSDETASPMPMGTLLSVLGNLASGARVVLINFMASFAMMGVAQLGRLVLQNLPIILNILGLTRANMARVIVDGVTRAQCLERAACFMGQHASTYQSTPDVLRWLRSPDPRAVEHPVWGAFRAAAEGQPMQCEAFQC